jgi:hypothetical protein
MRGFESGVGLGGDGDEIDAIRNVEREFGVKLDTSGAGGWVTAGQVYMALCEALPPDAPVEGRWDRFAAALASESGVDPKRLTVASPLIAPGYALPWWVIPVAVSSVIAWIAIQTAI